MEYHRPGSLQTTEMYLSQFWRLEALADSVSRGGLLSGPYTIYHLLAVSSHGARGRGPQGLL